MPYNVRSVANDNDDDYDKNSAGHTLQPARRSHTYLLGYLSILEANFAEVCIRSDHSTHILTYR
jgi:hypothetical protein